MGADDFPFVVPVSLAGAEPRGIVLDAADGLIPAGNRRAGLTAHSFGRHVVGQHQRKHTGWLQSDPTRSRIVYSPHTNASYRMPPSKFVYRLVTGGATRLGVPAARRADLLPERRRSTAPPARARPNLACEPRQWLSSTRSISPYSSACSALKKRSRSMSRRTSS
jgi:hypothetical protein